MENSSSPYKISSMLVKEEHKEIAANEDFLSRRPANYLLLRDLYKDKKALKIYLKIQKKSSLVLNSPLGHRYSEESVKKKFQK